MRTLAAFLITVVLTVILPVADEALVDAEAVLAVVAGSGTQQRVCRCEGRTEQVTRAVSQSPRDAQSLLHLGCGLLGKQRTHLGWLTQSLSWETGQAMPWTAQDFLCPILKAQPSAMPRVFVGYPF